MKETIHCYGTLLEWNHSGHGLLYYEVENIHKEHRLSHFSKPFARAKWRFFRKLGCNWTKAGQDNGESFCVMFRDSNQSNENGKTKHP